MSDFKEGDGEEWKKQGSTGGAGGCADGMEFPDDLPEIMREIVENLSSCMAGMFTPPDMDGPAPEGSYVLDGEIIKVPATYGEYIEGFEISKRTVQCDDGFQDGTGVSTVFLGLDHSFNEGTPVLFESLAVLNGEETAGRRYHTYEAALTGHREMQEMLARLVGGQA